MIGEFFAWLVAVDPISQFVLIVSTFAWIVGIVSLTVTARDFLKFRSDQGKILLPARNGSTR